VRRVSPRRSRVPAPRPWGDAVAWVILHDSLTLDDYVLVVVDEPLTDAQVAQLLALVRARLAG
jgi:hypothetical protein